MIGSRCNKTNKERGQVLLITVMLLATALTVVLSLSFRSVTETKLSKLEEENQKAIAAAESAIEMALKKTDLGEGMTFSDLGLDLSGINLNSSSVSVDQTTYDYFITPLLLKDDQYVYYLHDYDPVHNDITTGSSYSGGLTFYIESPESGGNVAVELTYLSGTVASPTITRYIIDPHTLITVGQNGQDSLETISGGTFQGINFGYKTSSPVATPGNAKILIVRVLNKQTRVGIAGADLKVQGRTIISEARASAGSTKRIKFFQSYPQIPAEFFVTSF